MGRKKLNNINNNNKKNAKKANLAFVFLIPKAEADVDVTMTMWHVLSLHQSDLEYACPNLAFQLIFWWVISPWSLALVLLL